MNTAATVYLVGAGPGDPELLTVRAVDCLKRADVVIYDYLASEDVIRLAPENTRLIFVGKKGFSQHIGQDQINACLIDEAKEHPGSVIVRLKGGDPFVFGRGGEEAKALSREGIPFEVVPGITAGIAAPAYAGIPVTHRGMSSSITLVTGHETPEKDVSSIDWAALAKGAGTICFYMGVRNLDTICSRLMEHGRPPSTPVALVRWGTLPRQQTLVATLETVAARARIERFAAPAIVVVGEVVALRQELCWFERRTLFGKRVVITRAREQAGKLHELLQARGADVTESPVISIEPCDEDDSGGFSAHQAIQRLSSYDWVVFTSVNGVALFFDLLADAGGDARTFGDARIAAIGPATAQALLEHGIRADLVPDRFIGEAVADSLIERGVGEGSRVLVPRALVARDTLPDMLRERGALVDVAPVYRTKLPSTEASFEALRDRIEAGEIDAITFTAPSTARNLATVLGDQDDSTRQRRLLEGVVLASIGPVTSRAMKELGFDVSVEARTHTMEGLVEALETYYVGKDGDPL